MFHLHKTLEETNLIFSRCDSGCLGLEMEIGLMGKGHKAAEMEDFRVLIQMIHISQNSQNW